MNVDALREQIRRANKSADAGRHHAALNGRPMSKEDEKALFGSEFGARGPATQPQRVRWLVTAIQGEFPMSEDLAFQMRKRP